MSQRDRDRTSDLTIGIALLRSQHRVACGEFAVHQGRGVLGNVILASRAQFSSTSKRNMDLGFRLNSLPLVHRSTPGYNLPLLRSSEFAYAGFKVAAATLRDTVTMFSNSIPPLSHKIRRLGE